MAGVTVQEGRIYIGNAIYNSQDLVVGLFTNTSLGDTNVLADITQPDVLNGYAEQTVTAGSWAVTADSVLLSTPLDFTAVGGNFQSGGLTADIYGAYIRTTSGTPVILHFEAYGSILQILDGQTYRVDFSNIVV